MKSQFDNSEQDRSIQTRTGVVPRIAQTRVRRDTLFGIVAALSLLVLVAATATRMRIADSATSTGGTITARRGDLTITVTEAGSVRARNSINYTCEVSRRGGDLTILHIVPAGTYITQEDVDSGKVLVELDAPGLVIYGTGTSSDAYTAMRGGGGTSSGIIAAGETVYQGQTLISMPDTASMVAEISVHETEVDKVRPGQSAQIVPDAFPDRVLTGQVFEVAPLPDEQRGFMNPDLKVYKTLVSIDGTQDFLKIRMSCKVEILARQVKDAILVPIQVVANRQGRKVLFVVNGRDTQERQVQTGAFNDIFVQITEGLDEGEEVLLNPPLVFAGG